MSLVALGERYWALGLAAAARGAFERAQSAADAKDPEPALRLAELALSIGDGRAARKHADVVVKRRPGAAARTLLGRAQLAAGDIGAARMSFAVALDAAGATAQVRVRARLGLCRAATALGDAAGAQANAGAAFDDVIAGIVLGRREGALGPLGIDVDGDIRLIEETVALVAALGRGADAHDTVVKARAEHPDKPLDLVEALLLAARASHGEPGVSDDVADAGLFAAAAVHPSPSLRLRALERRVLKPNIDNATRAEVVAELETITQAWSDAASDTIDAGRAADIAEHRGRAWFVLAAAYEDDPRTSDKAEVAYRRGLAFQPGHAIAACRLALLMLERGDAAGALVEVERALRIDAGHGPTWRQAARVLDTKLGTQGPALQEVVARLLDAAYPGAGAVAGGVAPRLISATAEIARGDVLAGVYAHGHRVKNLLGIIGSRARSARKLAESDVVPTLLDKLKDLERDVTALYEEWAQYLRSMQTQRPTVEVVPIAPLINEVVVAIGARTSVPITVDFEAGLPDLRGDRVLLREAVMNIVSNAAEACAGTSGDVRVGVRYHAGATTPIVEIAVADTGSGIPRGQLSRVLAPGYTTKDTGSGVGLTIAERIVIAHHGRVAIDSEEGRGTTVTITLPTEVVGGLASLSLDGRPREEPKP
jgi:signal transduction histidine kinase